MRRAYSHLLIPLVLLVTACSIAGCYTLLKHPRPIEGPAEGDFRRCTECHSGYFHPAPYDPLYADPWWDYYLLPWWYRDVIVVSGEEPEMPERRTIIQRDPVRRLRGDGIGGTATGAGVSPPGGALPDRERTPATPAQPQTTKKKEAEGSGSDKRAIDDRTPVKREGEDKSKSSEDDKKTTDKKKE